MTPQISFPTLAAPRAVGIALRHTSSRVVAHLIGALQSRAVLTGFGSVCLNWLGARHCVSGIFEASNSIPAASGVSGRQSTTGGAVEPLDSPSTDKPTKTVYVPYPTSNSGVGGRAPVTLPKGPFDGTGRYE